MTIFLKILWKIILKFHCVLEIINDEEVKFEVNECMKELQVDFIRTESITLNMDFSLACTHHKLNFEVQMSKTCYIAIKLATMLYLKYLWFYSFGVFKFNLWQLTRGRVFHK
jgi:hypothetical protein